MLKLTTCQPAAVLCALCKCILSGTLWGKIYYYHCFSDADSEAERGWVSLPRPHSQHKVEVGYEPQEVRGRGCDPQLFWYTLLFCSCPLLVTGWLISTNWKPSIEIRKPTTSQSRGRVGSRGIIIISSKTSRQIQVFPLLCAIVLSLWLHPVAGSPHSSKMAANRLETSCFLFHGQQEKSLCLAWNLVEYIYFNMFNCTSVGKWPFLDNRGHQWECYELIVIG